ncbi:hypothetical protein D046_1577 [Vibrio parahaemolyticus V-223/04]|nr:hypothetical protein D046_1577 [Vibrio parahaemolyticus V-223/04]
MPPSRLVSSSLFTASNAGFIASPPNGSKPVIKTFFIATFKEKLFRRLLHRLFHSPTIKSACNQATLFCVNPL